MRRRTRAAAPRASPRVTIVSLLRKTTYSPRARSAPRLHVPMKPRFCALRSKRTPVTLASCSAAGLGDASSTTMISIGRAACCSCDALEARVGQHRLAVHGNDDRRERRRRGREGERRASSLRTSNCGAAARLEALFRHDLGAHAMRERDRDLRCAARTTPSPTTAAAGARPRATPRTSRARP